MLSYSLDYKLTFHLILKIYVGFSCNAVFGTGRDELVFVGEGGVVKLTHKRVTTSHGNVTELFLSRKDMFVHLFI